MSENSEYKEWIDTQANRFTRIGATFAIDSNGNIYEPSNGIAVSDGMVQWVLKLDSTLHAQLVDVFTSISIIADLNRSVLSGDNDRIYGVWLDLESSPVSYMIESGRLFHDLDKAFDYGIRHNQRYIFNLTTHDTIAVIGNVIDSDTGDDFLIESERIAQ